MNIGEGMGVCTLVKELYNVVDLDSFTSASNYLYGSVTQLDLSAVAFYQVDKYTFKSFLQLKLKNIMQRTFQNWQKRTEKPKTLFVYIKKKNLE